jgi:hypothetical protein
MPTRGLEVPEIAGAALDGATWRLFAPRSWKTPLRRSSRFAAPVYTCRYAPGTFVRRRRGARGQRRRISDRQRAHAPGRATSNSAAPRRSAMKPSNDTAIFSRHQTLTNETHTRRQPSQVALDDRDTAMQRTSRSLFAATGIIGVVATSRSAQAAPAAAQINRDVDRALNTLFVTQPKARGLAKRRRHSAVPAHRQSGVRGRGAGRRRYAACRAGLLATTTSPQHRSDCKPACRHSATYCSS